MGDILRSVAVMGGIVLALWVAGLTLTRTPETAVRPVDYEPIAQSARQVVEYPLLSPGTLPDGWLANGARFSPGPDQLWHLGVLTDQERYIGLEQSTLPADEMVERFAEGSEPDGTIEVGDRVWELRSGPDDRITLVDETDGATTLVTTGTAPIGDVRRYVALLSAG
ncbi:hypothetical protein HMPREF0063_11959 [Aeromicrobium marinum DSM 15272]|uniref:DUF4245 domain-containing protein n=2 Tax=Aeromicrobium marinum TaxID=219314 RepID=E2SE23_9ACTN|nr:hypothetical protein HMPREF0063_11959 [Aeromicrobium marinum DSM 15272]